MSSRAMNDLLEEEEEGKRRGYGCSVQNGVHTELTIFEDLCTPITGMVTLGLAGDERYFENQTMLAVINSFWSEKGPSIKSADKQPASKTHAVYKRSVEFLDSGILAREQSIEIREERRVDQAEACTVSFIILALSGKWTNTIPIRLRWGELRLITSSSEEITRVLRQTRRSIFFYEDPREGLVRSSMKERRWAIQTMSGWVSVSYTKAKEGGYLAIGQDVEGFHRRLLEVCENGSDEEIEEVLEIDERREVRGAVTPLFGPRRLVYCREDLVWPRNFGGGLPYSQLTSSRFDEASGWFVFEGERVMATSIPRSDLFPGVVVLATLCEQTFETLQNLPRSRVVSLERNRSDAFCFLDLLLAARAELEKLSCVSEEEEKAIETFLFQSRNFFSNLPKAVKRVTSDAKKIILQVQDAIEQSIYLREVVSLAKGFEFPPESSSRMSANNQPIEEGIS